MTLNFIKLLLQVEVEVVECEVDENGKMIKKSETVNSLSNFDSVQLRDSSRKNLRRLGALYSETEQFASPIQRTEENFCESSDGNEGPSRPIKKITKLASLAKDMNSWEDDYSHHGSVPNSASKASPMKSTGAIPKVFGSPAKTPSGFNFGSPSRTNFASPSKTNFSSPVRQNNLSKPKFASPMSSNREASDATASKPSPKKLLWDKKVMDSLEAQGFTRRESQGPKLVYNYGTEKPATTSSSANASTTPTQSSTPGSSKDSPKKLSSTNTFTKPASPAKKEAPKILKSTTPAANKAARKSIFKKDPADMSLKERMAIFEKNKGTAPVPKTPYGITDVAPTKTDVEEVTRKYKFGKAGYATMQQKPKPRQEPPKVIETVKETVPDNAAANVKTTLNKLINEKEMTISERAISEKIRREREEELKAVLNRFNRDTSEESTTPAVTTTDNSDNNKNEGKRYSNGEKYTEQLNDEVCQKLDDKKRSRVSNTQRLYPVLSDLDSPIETTDSEMDNYTTATVSGEEPMHEIEDYEMDSDLEEEDEDPNVSFGKQILKSVTKHNDLRRSDYLDSTVSSNDASGAIGDMDDYLNEAFDDDEDSKNYDDKGSAYSDSFQYEKYPQKRVSFKEPEEIPVKTRLEFSPAKSPSGSHTLVHTVSFYRKQQSASANNTPMKRVVHQKGN